MAWNFNNVSTWCHLHANLELARLILGLAFEALLSASMATLKRARARLLAHRGFVSGRVLAGFLMRVADLLTSMPTLHSHRTKLPAAPFWHLAELFKILD
jgi:hypothetical protein